MLRFVQPTNTIDMAIPPGLAFQPADTAAVYLTQHPPASYLISATAHNDLPPGVRRHYIPFAKRVAAFSASETTLAPAIMLIKFTFPYQ